MAMDQPAPKPPAGSTLKDVDTVIIPLGDYQPKSGPPVKK
jgi:hypothetical protein